MWSAKAYNSLKSLGSWIRDLTLRLDFICVSFLIIAHRYFNGNKFICRHGFDSVIQFPIGFLVFIFLKVFLLEHYRRMLENIICL